MTTSTGAGWYSDLSGRHELRYFNNQWTDHVSDGGVVSTSPLQPSSAAPAVAPGVTLSALSTPAPFPALAPVLIPEAIGASNWTPVPPTPPAHIAQVAQPGPQAARNRRGSTGVIAGFIVIALVAVALVVVSRPSAMASAPPIVGTWTVPYGAPTVVTIKSSGHDSFVARSTTRVKVTGSDCYLPVGTLLATLSGSGYVYTGHHGLWSESTCVFAYFTTLTFTITDKTAFAKLGDGESNVWTKISGPQSSKSTSLWMWLWLSVTFLAILAAVVYWLRERRKRPAA